MLPLFWGLQCISFGQALKSHRTTSSRKRLVRGVAADSCRRRLTKAAFGGWRSYVKNCAEHEQGKEHATRRYCLSLKVPLHHCSQFGHFPPPEFVNFSFLQRSALSRWHESAADGRRLAKRMQTVCSHFHRTIRFFAQAGNRDALSFMSFRLPCTAGDRFCNAHGENCSTTQSIAAPFRCVFCLF